jgi:hypothetical protein
MIPKHRAVAAASVLCIAVIGAWWGPVIAARYKYAHPLVFSEKEVTAAPSKYLVLVRKAVERRRGRDSGIGYRTSRVCVYVSDAKTAPWQRSLGPLPMRTEATTRFPPDDADTSDVLEILRSEGTYAYGHFSIPEGVYWGCWRVDETARNKHAIALSGIGVLNNTIRLMTTETITVFHDVEATGIMQGIILPRNPRSFESVQKGNCFIHGSSRTDWHHRDSMGCLNLCRTPGSLNEQSDWETFEEYFRRYDIGRDGPILVAIVRAEDNLFNQGFPAQVSRSELDAYLPGKQHTKGEFCER